MILSSDIKPYILRFGITYMTGIVILSVTFIFFNLDHSIGASIAVLMGSALLTVTKFIQNHKRVPTKREKTIFVLTSIILAWIISLLLMVFTALISGGQDAIFDLVNMVLKIGVPIIISTSIFITILYLAVLSYSYGSFANKQYESMKKKKNIKKA